MSERFGTAMPFRKIALHHGVSVEDAYFFADLLVHRRRLPEQVRTNLSSPIFDTFKSDMALEAACSPYLDITPLKGV